MKELKYEEVNWPVAYALIPSLEIRIARAKRNHDRKGKAAGFGVSPYYTDAEHRNLDEYAKLQLQQQGIPGEVDHGFYCLVILDYDDELERLKRSAPIRLRRKNAPRK